MKINGLKGDKFQINNTYTFRLGCTDGRADSASHVLLWPVLPVLNFSSRSSFSKLYGLLNVIAILNSWPLRTTSSASSPFSRFSWVHSYSFVWCSLTFSWMLRSTFFTWTTDKRSSSEALGGVFRDSESKYLNFYIFIYLTHRHTRAHTRTRIHTHTNEKKYIYSLYVLSVDLNRSSLT